MNKKKLIYRESIHILNNGLADWKDLRDEKGNDIYTEYNNVNEIVFDI